MANFDLAYKITRKFEGGYCKIDGDKGGETFDGISRINHPNWEGWILIDKFKKLKGFPNNIDKLQIEPLVYIFYKENFWDKIFGDKINSQIIASNFYDNAVNSGVKTAIKELQKSYEYQPYDGIMTDRFLKKINE